jgi:hypothetical protein
MVPPLEQLSLPPLSVFSPNRAKRHFLDRRNIPNQRSQPSLRVHLSLLLRFRCRRSSGSGCGNRGTDRDAVRENVIVPGG